MRELDANEVVGIATIAKQVYGVSYDHMQNGQLEWGLDYVQTEVGVGRCLRDPGLTALHPMLAFRHFQGLSGAFRGFQLLKLKYDKLLSTFAFNCNLRHYTEALRIKFDVGAKDVKREILTF